MSKRSERIQLGLCPNCGNSNSSEYVICDICREKNRQKCKERYVYRKANGLCVACGNPTENGCRCEKCAKKASEYVSDTHKMRKELGCCINCGEPLDRNSKQFCTYHKMEKRMQSQSEYERIKQSDKYSEYRAKQTEYQRQRTELRKENGLCIRCGKREVLSYRSQRMCRWCLEKTNKELRESRFSIHRDQIVEGVDCKICCKPVETQGNKLCNRCLENCRRNIAVVNANRDNSNHSWRKIHYGRGIYQTQNGDDNG